MRRMLGSSGCSFPLSKAFRNAERTSSSDACPDSSGESSVSNSNACSRVASSLVPNSGFASSSVKLRVFCKAMLSLISVFWMFSKVLMTVSTACLIPRTTSCPPLPKSSATLSPTNGSFLRPKPSSARTESKESLRAPRTISRLMDLKFHRLEMFSNSTFEKLSKNSVIVGLLSAEISVWRRLNSPLTKAGALWSPLRTPC